MKTKAYLPVGTKEIKEDKLISKGDIVLLCTGEKVTFEEMKRTKFHGKLNGKGIVVPIWRDRLQTVPFISKVTGVKDKSVIIKSAPIDKFKFGQLFALEGHKETFMFVENTIKRNKKKTIAIDLATGKEFTIGGGFTVIKINLPKLKKEKAVS